MALVILTGSLSDTALTMGAAALPIKCLFGRFSCQFVRSATRSTTFCSTGWVSEIPGEIQGLLSLIGYVTTGSLASDPLVYITSAVSLAFVLTATASCTLTGAVNCFSDGVDLVAAANSSRGVDFRTTAHPTTGTTSVASAWVTA